MASADPPEHAWRRRNFLWAALNGALFEFGASLADTGTVVATFLGRLTPAPMAVGAAASIARFGWLVPQLFAANYAQGLRYRKGIYLVGGWGRAVALGALAAVLLWPSSLPHAPGVVLAVFFALWTLFSFVAGLAGAAYNDVIGRTIASGSRSRLLATRLFVGATLAAGGGLLIRAILGASPAPSLREVVRRDRRFRLFLYAQWLGGVTRMVLPFYIVQARTVGGLPELEVGTLLAAQAVGGIALNPLWGWWGDRRGKLSLLKVLAVTSAVSPLLAIVLPALELTPNGALAGYALVFFFVGASANGEIIGDLGYLMEISPDDRRPEYSGYMNALVAPSRLLPFVGGVLLEVVSFQSLFALAAAAALVARLAVLLRLGPQRGGQADDIAGWPPDPR